MSNAQRSNATEAAPATDNGLLDKVIAQTPDMDAIWKGKLQTYQTYDGRQCAYRLPMLEAVLGETFKSAPIKERVAFVTYCIIKQLDPISKQVYFIKYEANAPASFVTDWMVFVDRAQRHPQFDGFESGVIWIDGDGKTTRGKPCDYAQTSDHRIFGGWATVYRKDQKVPRDVEVPLSEMQATKRDGTPARAWQKMLTTMATKTPAARALRQSFPEKLGGLMIEEELALPERDTRLESGDAAPMDDLNAAADQMKREEEPPPADAFSETAEVGEQPAENDPFADWTDYQVLIAGAETVEQINKVEHERVSHLPEKRRAEAHKLANEYRQKRAKQAQSAKPDKATKPPKKDRQKTLVE